MFISERLDQMDQVGVLHLLRGQDVPLVQLLHCSCSGEKYITITFVLKKKKKAQMQHVTHSDLLSQKKGSFMAMFFSSCSVSVSVALNSSVCRLAGKIPRISSRSLVKSVQPCSNSRSASSKI